MRPGKQFFRECQPRRLTHTRLLSHSGWRLSARHSKEGSNPPYSLNESMNEKLEGPAEKE